MHLFVLEKPTAIDFIYQHQHLRCTTFSLNGYISYIGSVWDILDEFINIQLLIIDSLS